MLSSPTRSTPLWMFPRGRGSRGIVVSAPSVQVRGIRMRTSLRIMREYSSSKTSSGRSVQSSDEQKKRVELRCVLLTSQSAHMLR